MLKASTSDARMKHLAHGYEIGSPAHSLGSIASWQGTLGQHSTFIKNPLQGVVP